MWGSRMIFQLQQFSILINWYNKKNYYIVSSHWNEKVCEENPNEALWTRKKFIGSHFDHCHICLEDVFISVPIVGLKNGSVSGFFSDTNENTFILCLMDQSRVEETVQNLTW